MLDQLREAAQGVLQANLAAVNSSLVGNASGVAAALKEVVRRGSAKK